MYWRTNCGQSFWIALFQFVQQRSLGFGIETAHRLNFADQRRELTWIGAAIDRRDWILHLRCRRRNGVFTGCRRRRRQYGRSSMIPGTRVGDCSTGLASVTDVLVAAGTFARTRDIRAHYRAG